MSGIKGVFMWVKYGDLQLINLSHADKIYVQIFTNETWINAVFGSDDKSEDRIISRHKTEDEAFFELERLHKILNGNP